MKKNETRIITGLKLVNQIQRIRPGYGLEPKYYEKLLGKKSPLSISRGNPLKKIVINKLKIN